MSVTVPVAPDPLATLTGAIVNDSSARLAGGLIVNVADCVTPFALALMTTVDAVRIVVVSIVKLALVAPCGTVTLAGTVANEVSSLLSATITPPACAGLESVTLPVTGFPPTTADGVSVIDVSSTGAALIVSDALADVAPVVARIVAVVVLIVALLVATLNDALVVPAATFTDDGTVASLRSLAREMVTPPAGAAPVRVTVPLALVPAFTVEGDRLTLATTAGSIVSVADDVPFAEAVIVAAVVAATGVVVTLNDAVDEPAATVTDDGTLAAALFELSVTLMPPAGALLLSVTVPLALTPPVTCDGVTVSAVRAGAVIVSVAVRAMLPDAAVIVTRAGEVTWLVPIAKLPLTAPSATTTDDGTVAEVELLESATIMPPEGAGPLSTTVPVALVPPVTLAGSIVMALSCDGEIVIVRIPRPSYA